MKSFLMWVCAGSTALLLLWPANAAAQHRGGHGGSHPSPPLSRGSGAAPGGEHARVAPPAGFRSFYGHSGYRTGLYRPYVYRPYFSPFWSNGLYASFYYGLGYYPYYWNLADGYPWGYDGLFGYPYGPYPYPAYAYGAWSTARLEMKPREAQVFLDGYYVGIVDDFDGVFQRLDVPAGQHELTVYLPGYETWRQQVMFLPGKGYHYKGQLQPLPPGTPQEPRPQPDPNARQNQPRGYGQPNYGPPDAGQPGYPAPAGVDPRRMRPMPPRPPAGDATSGFGSLTLRVQPGDATVQIDGEKWDSPEGGSRLVVQLAAGPHRIEVRKDGFRPYSTTVQIRSGEPQTLNVVLPEGH